MSTEDTDFTEKLKTLSLDELKKYETAAAVSNRAINIIAIFSILLGFMYPVIPVILVIAIFVYICAKVAVGYGEALTEIRLQISKTEPPNR